MTLRIVYFNQYIKNDLVGGNMFWIDTDKAIPAYDDQVVKIKVVDPYKDYTTIGWYDHQREEWFSIDGLCLHDNVYAWRHPHPRKKILREERQARMAKWE